MNHESSFKQASWKYSEWLSLENYLSFSISWLAALKGTGASWVLERNSSAHICPCVMHQLSRTWSIQGPSVLIRWLIGLLAATSYCMLYVITHTNTQCGAHTESTHAHTYTHNYSTQRTWARDLRTHLLGIGRQCMQVCCMLNVSVIPAPLGSTWIMCIT